MPLLQVDIDVHAAESKFLSVAVDDGQEIIRDQSSIERAVV